MVDVSVAISEEKRHALLTVTGAAGVVQVELNATEMTEIVATFGYVRSEMMPALSIADVDKTTPFSKAPVDRFQVLVNEEETEARLFLRHPGFGWIWMPFSRAAAETLIGRRRMFLLPRKSPQ